MANEFLKFKLTPKVLIDYSDFEPDCERHDYVDDVCVVCKQPAQE